MTYYNDGDYLSEKCCYGTSCSSMKNPTEYHNTGDCELGNSTGYDLDQGNGASNTSNRECTVCGWTIECQFEKFWYEKWQRYAYNPKKARGIHDFCKSKKWVNV